MKIVKKCKRGHFGVDNWIITAQGATVCKRCINLVSKQRRKSLKDKAIQYKGGSCYKCGYNKCPAALDFHHLDPTTKGAKLIQAIRSWEEMKTEIDKCILICSNCHRELHWIEDQKWFNEQMGNKPAQE